MTVLRHEEFEKGCEATCNGPYDGKWSKTMIGYGPEDSHFVLEITYNYPIDKYQLGNDFLGVTIGAPTEKIDEIKAKGEWQEEKGQIWTSSPAGYKFFLEQDDHLSIKGVSLATSSIASSLRFWNEMLDMKVLSKDENQIQLTYDEAKQATLRLIATPNGAAVDHATAFGRIAFALPTPDLPPLEQKIANAEGLGTVKTPLVVLPTPGKADVQVIILEDPVSSIIC